MDAKTRYLLACQVTETRYIKDARKPLAKAKEDTDVEPDAIVTDGLMAYKDAIKAEYFGLGRIQNPHVRLKDFETKPNNNILERLNGTFRERTKVMRSFDSGLVRQNLRRGCRHTTITSGLIRESAGWYRPRWQTSRSISWEQMGNDDWVGSSKIN